MAAAFSHVIFDLDGTILNTLEDLAAAGNHTCETHGWPTFAVDEYRYKVGNGMLKLVERFMPAEYAGDGRMFEQTLAEFRAYYGEHKEPHRPLCRHDRNARPLARRGCAACRAH